MFIPIPLVIVLAIVIISSIAASLIFHTKSQDALLEKERMDAKLARKMNQINSGKFIHFPTHLLSPRIVTLLELMSPHSVDKGQESVINKINKNKFGRIKKHKKSTYLLLLVNDILGQYVDKLHEKHSDDSESWLNDVVHFHFNFAEQRENDFHLSPAEDRNLRLMQHGLKDMEDSEIHIANSVSAVY